MQKIVRLGLTFFGVLLFSTAIALMTQRTTQAQTQSPETPSLAPSDDGSRVTGILQSKPLSGTLGEWRIAAITVTANASTRFPNGSLALGSCARANYQRKNDVNLASEIRRSDDCEGGGEGEHESIETKGIVQSFPADLIGVWQISDKSYTTTAATQFEQHEHPFSVGGCVEVKHLISSTLALRIKTDDDCAGQGGEHHFAIARGTLITFPADLIGTWTVNTQTYQVVSSTQLERRHGNFFAGACVQVTYNPTATRVAYQVETESPDDCGNAPSVVTPTLEAHGVITGMPTGSMFGTWFIGGKSYQAISGTTTFKQEHGVLALNKCAEVKYFKQGDDRIATRIQSEGGDDCGREGDHDNGGKPERHEAFGAIVSLPESTDLIGTWMIGERAYSVTTATLLSNGPFTVGLFVEVHYTRTVDGGLLAASIEGKNRIDQEDRRGGKAYGRIDSRPLSPTVQGTWVIASVTYSVTNTTRLFGSLNISDCVQVHYQTDAGGLRVARKIKQDERCRVDAGKPINKAHGFVTRLPANGFVGTWEIGGVLYEASATTQFSETHGALAIGAYVEIEFNVSNGVKLAREISTQVPPEAGELDDKGKLSLGGAGLSADATQTWTINGKTYQILDATLLEDVLGSLSNGQTVRVNAYVNAQGQRVATLVAAEGAAKEYLPITYR